MDREVLRQRLLQLGFDVVRFVRLDAATPGGQSLEQWLQQGAAADMDWIGRSVEKRVDPQRVLPGARSAVLLGVNYWQGDGEPGRPVWARYALYQDYHDTIKAALVAAGKTLEEWAGINSTQYRYYVDTGPVLERGWAERGGVGFIGKNAMLISRDFGNWLFLAEILTTVDLDPDEPLASVSRSDGQERGRVGLSCGRCTRCMDSCPTGAIRAPGTVDARLCISYHTIENRGIIPRAIREAMGARIYGCDACLEVCPWNRFAQQSRGVLLSSRHDLSKLTLEDILTLTPERFSEVFRGTAIKRTKLSGLLRNACIVAANTGARHCLPQLLSLAAHALPVVRAHAVWAVFGLARSSDAWQLLAAQEASESDPWVLAEYAAERALQAPIAPVNQAGLPAGNSASIRSENTFGGRTGRP